MWDSAQRLSPGLCPYHHTTIPVGECFENKSAGMYRGGKDEKRDRSTPMYANSWDSATGKTEIILFSRRRIPTVTVTVTEVQRSC